MKDFKTIITKSEQETIDEAAKLLKALPKSTNLIFLNGEIGSGKTTLVKGFAKALNITEDIVSPTYGYKSVYEGLVHYDLYLAKKAKEIRSLISEDLEDNVVIIEWGNKVPKIKDSIIIDITPISFTSREIKVRIQED